VSKIINKNDVSREFQFQFAVKETNCSRLESKRGIYIVLKASMP